MKEPAVGIIKNWVIFVGDDAHGVPHEGTCEAQREVRDRRFAPLRYYLLPHL